MIDTTLRATSEKLKPGACRTRGGSAQLVGAEPREERLDRGAALRGAEIAPRRLVPGAGDDEGAARRVEPGLERGQALVAHQHEIVRLGLVAR